MTTTKTKKLAYPYVWPRPYQPYWGNNFGDAGNASQLNTLATAADGSYNVGALSNPTVAHVCEVT